MENKMSPEFIEVLKIIGPVLAAVASGGAFAAYYNYKGGKPKTAAEAQKLQADVVVTFAEGWKGYAEKLEGRLERTENDIAALRKALEEQDDKYRGIIKQKDEEIAKQDREIASLKAKNGRLEARVAELEKINSIKA